MPKKQRPKLYEDGPSRTTPQEQETMVARSMGGRTQPGSGSKDHAKGDVLQAAREAAFRPDRFLIECKQTEKASMSIKGSWLAKITREAAAVGREPMLEFEIQGCDDPMLERQWVALPMSVFKRLTDDEE